MSPDLALRGLAERQHAVVSVAQARSLLTRRQLESRTAGPEWEFATRRVLRLAGAPTSPEQPLMIAILDAGGRTVGASRAAAAIWRVPGFSLRDIELSRERGRSGRRPTFGVLHEPRFLPEHHLTVVRGVPVTTLPRTIFDLAGHLRPERTERIVASVIGKSPGTLRVLHSLLPELAEHGRNGIVVMRDILERNPVGCVVEQTGLERRVNHILREAGEQPLVPQVDVGGHEWIGRVDFRDPLVSWVLYEVDSDLFHSSPLDVLLDAERDAALYAAGFRRVVRIPELHVWYEPWRILETVRRIRREARSTAAA
jgi:hypothetical protein